MKRAMVTLLVFSAILGALFPSVTGISQASSPGKWGLTPEMSAPRFQHSATVLAGPECGGPTQPRYCGKVLAAGGRQGPPPGDIALDSAEIYDPRTRAWLRCESAQTGSDCPGRLQQPRYGHTATLLSGPKCEEPSRRDYCGKILIAGGSSRLARLPRSTELYDPATGRFSDEAVSDIPNTISLGLSHIGHTATQLPGGEILFVGREDEFPPTAKPGLIYDPESDNWSETPGDNVAFRVHHAAIMLGGGECLHCGKVLIVGGGGTGGVDPTARIAELYDPATQRFLPTSSPPQPVAQSDAAMLEDGGVLVAGSDGPTDRSQVYDPSTGQWNETGPMNHARLGKFLAKISGGRILAAGGNPSARSAEIFYPDELAPGGARGNWRLAPDELNYARQYSAPTALDCADGSARVLLSGGSSESRTSETYQRMVSLTQVDPRHSRLGGGATTTIRGSGLKPATGEPDVKIGSKEAVVVSFSETEIVARVPSGEAPGKLPVSVSVDGAVPECSPELKFEYLPVPNLSGINPPVGLALGGTRVSLTGSGFVPGSSVRFGDRPSDSVEVSPDGTRIIAEAPPNDPGPVPVVVTTPAGDAVETTFKYLPAITGIAPDMGPPEGGTIVTLAGKGFSGARTVSFDGIEVVPTQVADDAVTVKSPPHPPGQVRVGVDVPPHGPAIPVAAGVDTFTYGAQAVSLGGGAGQISSGGSSSFGPGSQTPNISGGGPAASGGSGPPPGQGQAVPVLSQSPASVFEPGSSAMQSGSGAPDLSPAGVQMPGAAGSHAPGGQPALVSVPEVQPDEAQQFAMVGHSGKGINPSALTFAAGFAGLVLCGGLILSKSQAALLPQARPQEAL